MGLEAASQAIGPVLRHGAGRCVRRCVRRRNKVADGAHHARVARGPTGLNTPCAP
jgi:hypothetical protein